MSSETYRSLLWKWERLAEEVGGVASTVLGTGAPTLEVPIGQGMLRFDALMTDTNSWTTRARFPFHDSGRTAFGLTDEGFLTGFFKALGFVQDVEIGHARFDERFVVKAFPIARVSALLAPPVADQILELPRSSRVLFRHPSGLPGDPPSGVTFLEFLLPGLQPRVQPVIEAARALAPRLDPVGHRRDERPEDTDPVDEVEALVQEAIRVGGDIVDGWTGQVLWDLHLPRIRALRELAERADPRAAWVFRELIGDDEPRLSVESMRGALALRDREARPAIVEELGRRDQSVEGGTVSGHAGEVLRGLGEDDLVEAFEAAVGGDPDPARAVGGSWRGPLIRALMRVTASFDLVARVHAARALGVMGAREALDLLRDNRSAMGIKTKFSRACEEAVEAIEAQASLPRPASATEAEPRDTLPRPAEGRTGSRDELPRPADRPGEP